MLADELDYVVGVDSQRDEHVLAVVTAPAGAVVARRVIGADRRVRHCGCCWSPAAAPSTSAAKP